MKEWAEPMQKNAAFASENIVLCPDGKYRWIYELKLLKNPTVLLVLWKIFGGISFGIWLFTVLASCGNIDFWWTGFFKLTKVFALFLLGMIVLTALGYLLYAALMGGKYCVLFTMDERGVVHERQPRQAQKAQLMGELLELAGLVAGSPTMVGIGMNAARTVMESSFDKVKSIQGIRRYDLIKVNGRIGKNQVYAEDVDYDFVWQYITSRCPNAKIRD